MLVNKYVYFTWRISMVQVKYFFDSQHNCLQKSKLNKKCTYLSNYKTSQH